MESPDDNALLNACVLGRLFEFVDVDTLKTSRLVCHTWNTFAGWALRKRSTVCFDSAEKCVEFNMTMNTCMDENSRRFKNLSFRVICDKTWDLAENTVFTECGKSVESLRLILSLCYRYKENFARTLQSLKMLEHLEITEDFGGRHIQNNIFKSGHFQKLQSCTLQFGDICSANPDGNDEDKTQLVVDLLKSCERTLKKLELKLLPGSFYNQVFQEVDLKGLLHLILGGGRGKPSEMPVDVIQTLPTFCPHLEYLECWFPIDISHEIVYNLLDSLKNLRSFKITFTKRLFSTDPGQVVPIKTFPVLLPNVKSVSLIVPFHGDVGIFATCFPQAKKLDIELPCRKEHKWKPMAHLEEIRIRKSPSCSMRGFAYKDFTSSNFPHLTKLEMQLERGRVTAIFENLQNLKELILDDGSTVRDEDITGISKKDLQMADQGRILRTHPYIGNLKNLQVLYLGSVFVSSDSITYGIADLESLTKLTIKFRRNPIEYLLKRGKIYQHTACRPRKTDEKWTVDLKSLMLPKVKYLVELVVIIQKFDPFPVDSKQLEDMRRTRTGFSYKVKNEYPK